MEFLIMSKVDEIEAAIDRLPTASRWKLAQRLNVQLWDAWDDDIASFASIQEDRSAMVRKGDR